jgi:hypothetical protein
MSENKISKEKQALMEIVEAIIRNFNSTERHAMKEAGASHNYINFMSEYDMGYRAGLRCAFDLINYHLRENGIGGLTEEERIVTFVDADFEEFPEDGNVTVCEGETT